MTLASGSAIGEILKQMKAAASAARGEDLTADQRLALQSDYDALRSQIDRIAASAQFNGTNLSAAGGADLDVIISDHSSAGVVQLIRTANSNAVLGAPVRVSTNSSGLETVGGGSSSGVLSPDGRYVAFQSEATNLVPSDTNNARDTFMKDLQTGEVRRLSVSASGAQQTGASYDTLVAFASGGGAGDIRQRCRQSHARGH